jgi:hypothetical protein
MDKEGVNGAQFMMSLTRQQPDGTEITADEKITVCVACLINLDVMLAQLKASGQFQTLIENSDISIEPQKKIITPDNCGRVAPVRFPFKKPGT